MFDPKLKKHIYRQRPALDIKKKFIFFSNNKVAKRSILWNQLKNRAIMRTTGETSNYKVFINSFTDKQIQQIFKFTITRNPWDRTVSAFFYLKYLAQTLSVRKSLIRCAGELINPNETFKNFIKTKLAIHGSHINAHFHNQHPNAFFRNKPFVDYIAKFENIKKDWAYIASKIDTNPILPHDNKSEHKHYTEYYDNECIQIVKKIYQKDIELLEYDY